MSRLLQVAYLAHFHQRRLVYVSTKQNRDVMLQDEIVQGGLGVFINHKYFACGAIGVMQQKHAQVTLSAAKLGARVGSVHEQARRGRSSGTGATLPLTSLHHTPEKSAEQHTPHLFVRNYAGPHVSPGAVATRNCIAQAHRARGLPSHSKNSHKPTVTSNLVHSPPLAQLW